MEIIVKVALKILRLLFWSWIEILFKDWLQKRREKIRKQKENEAQKINLEKEQKARRIIKAILPENIKKEDPNFRKQMFVHLLLVGMNYEIETYIIKVLCEEHPKDEIRKAIEIHVKLSHRGDHSKIVEFTCHLDK